MKQEISQLTQKEWSVTNKRGFSLVEAVLSTALFALLATIFVGVYLYGQESTSLAGNRARAVLFAKEGLEAVRNIKDEDFANLTDGTHGLSTSGNQWSLSGSSDSNGIFTREIEISTVDSDRKEVTSTITWQQNAQRNGEVSLVTYMTSWESATPEPSCNSYAISEGYSSGTCRQNPAKCSQNGESHLADGDAYCVSEYPGNPSQNTCCVLP